MEVTQSNSAELISRINSLSGKSEKFVQKCTSDFASRAPGWISKGVRQHYGVDANSLKNPSVVKNGNDVKIKYRGRPLTLTHFNMNPKTQPTARQSKSIKVPGQKISGSAVATIRPPKKYKVKATIIKGTRSTMSSNSFVANSLPFQRSTNKALPVDVIHTVSIPQMIDGRAKETVQNLIEEGMEKRIQNHMNQFGL